MIKLDMIQIIEFWLLKF